VSRNVAVGAVMLVAVLALTACAGPHATSGFWGGATAGAALGCGTGGIAAGRGGCALGAALGAGVGGIVGALAGHEVDRQQAATAETVAAARHAGRGSCRWVQKRDA